MATKPGEGLKQGQSVRVGGIWGTFNYLVGQDWAVITQDDGQQRVVKAEELRGNGQDAGRCQTCGRRCYNGSALCWDCKSTRERLND